MSDKHCRERLRTACLLPVVPFDLTVTNAVLKAYCLNMIMKCVVLNIQQFTI